MWLFSWFLIPGSWFLDATQPTRLPKVIVKAPPVPIPSPYKGTTVRTITAKDLEEQQAVTLVDALKRIPGVVITQDGGIGQRASASLRGGQAEHTMIMVDGMRISDVSAFNGAFNLAPWLVNDLAQIQVIQGPMSSLYGSSAIAGVIKIDSKKGSGPLKLFGQAEAGSFATYQQQVGTQGQKDLFDYQVSLTRLQSAGSPLTPDRRRSLVKGKANDPLHQENLSARLGVGSDQANITLFSRYLTRRLGYRQSLKPFRLNQKEIFQRLVGHFEGKEGRWINDVGFGYYENNTIDTNEVAVKRGENNGNQSQIDWQQAFQFSDTLKAQMMAEGVTEEFYTYFPGQQDFRKRSNHAGLGVSLGSTWVKDLQLTASARIDKYQGIASKNTYRLGAEYFFGDTTFRGSLGTGFKAPSLSQRFYRSTYYQGNPNLKPEHSFGWEVGIDQAFWNHHLTGGVTFFQNRIRDMIIWLGRTMSNQTKARTEGFEVTAKLQITKVWLAEITHTYTKAWNETTGIALVRRPRNKTTLRLTGQLTEQWQISGDFLCFGPQWDVVWRNNALSTIKMPGYGVLRAETSFTLNPQWQVYGRAENFLNHRYESPFDYQQPGFGVYAGVRAKW